MTENTQYRDLLKQHREKFFKDGDTSTDDELEILSLVKPAIKSGYWWGPWKLDGGKALFCYDPSGKSDNPVCWINLEKYNGSAEVLNSIFTTVNKEWATADVLANLLWALEDIFHPRKNICPGGTDILFDPGAYLAGLRDSTA
jgi:hypothetical protein